MGHQWGAWMRFGEWVKWNFDLLINSTRSNEHDSDHGLFDTHSELFLNTDRVKREIRLEITRFIGTLLSILWGGKPISYEGLNNLIHVFF